MSVVDVADCAVVELAHLLVAAASLSSAGNVRAPPAIEMALTSVNAALSGLYKFTGAAEVLRSRRPFAGQGPQRSSSDIERARAEAVSLSIELLPPRDALSRAVALVGVAGARVARGRGRRRSRCESGGGRRRRRWRQGLCVDQIVYGENGNDAAISRCGLEELVHEQHVQSVR